MKVNLPETTLDAHANMVLFSLLVAGSFPIGQVIAYQIDPIALTFLRFLLASVLLGAFLAWHGALRSADFRPLWRYLLLGMLFLLFYFHVRGARTRNTSVDFKHFHVDALHRNLLRSRFLPNVQGGRCCYLCCLARRAL